MLTLLDRVQVVVANRQATTAAFARLLDTEVMHQDTVRCLGAQRTVLALGTSEVELLEPDGTGAAADFLARTQGGLFAAGSGPAARRACEKFLLQRVALKNYGRHERRRRDRKC